MSRRVTIEVTSSVTIDMDEGVEVSEIMDEMDCSFDSQTDGADVLDTSVINYKVTDSK